MRFWDSSALVPVVCSEPQSSLCRRLLQQDSAVAASYWTPVELVSAIARKQREGSLSEEQRLASRERLQQLENAWIEVEPSSLVRSRARRLLDVHPLRAADSLQLAAALVFVNERTEGAEFVALDARLRAAAAREGFTLLP